MNNRLNRRIKQLEDKIGVNKQPCACYIEIRALLEESEKEETPRRIRLGGRLWATAERSPSPFSQEQISKLKTEYAQLTLEQIAAREEIPTYIHVWPNGCELRTNVDFLHGLE